MNRKSFILGALGLIGIGSLVSSVDAKENSKFTEEELRVAKLRGVELEPESKDNSYSFTDEEIRVAKLRGVSLNAVEKEEVLYSKLEHILKSPEGRAALARSMCEPIKHSWNYQEVGRKLFMVDNLPENIVTTYTKEVRIKT